MGLKSHPCAFARPHPTREKLLKLTVAALAALGALVIAPAAASASPCAGEPTSSQVFADFHDRDMYFLAPGGDFESGAGWDLRDGAEVHFDGSNSALALPGGSTAISPPICVAQGYPHGRMYGATASDRKARVEVDVIYDGEHGVDSADLKLRDTELAPTDRFLLDETAFGLDPITGAASVRLVFESTGVSTALIDDVYIDPRARN